MGGLGIAALAGCSGTNAVGSNPSTSATGTTNGNTVTDATSRTVTLPSSIDDIVAVGPGALNLVAYLDAIEMVAGVEENEHSWGQYNPYNLANPELQELPVIGPHKGGDAELIASAEPDVVLATYFTAGTASDLQEKIDAPVVVLKASSRPLHRLEGMYEDLRFAAEIIGKPDRAETVVEYFEDERDDLAERTADVPKDDRLGAYYAGRSDSGGAGATSTQHPLASFSFVNANNVADSIEGHADVSKEELVTWDPAAIFVAESNLDQVTESLSGETYEGIRAIENDRVYGLLPTRFYGNLYGSTIANAYYVGSILYPDRFDDVTPRERAGEIYEFLVGSEVYGALAEQYGGFKKIDLAQ
ncbi:MAG: ABC transporter substrate-binding protein [Halodesulfurarchaeum sp.]|nr:ABC transporter substrate-binding protein [Halodesulfurarchaeum sp.]